MFYRDIVLQYKGAARSHRSALILLHGLVRVKKLIWRPALWTELKHQMTGRQYLLQQKLSEQRF